jgi:CheY-like chemotaxis protein
MTKTVLDVGNCNPDHHSLKTMLTRNYDVNVMRSDALPDTLAILEKTDVDLILINRKLDIDYTDGMDVLKALKQSEKLRGIPVMLVTNYPEHQEAAVAAGGEYGFGKLQLADAGTHERLSRFLNKRSVNV